MLSNLSKFGDVLNFHHQRKCVCVRARARACVCVCVYDDKGKLRNFAITEKYRLELLSYR